MNQVTRWWIAGIVIALCVTFGILVRTPTGDVTWMEGSRDSFGMVNRPEAIREALETLGYVDVPESIVRSLSTLEKIDEYPVYTMRYVGPYLRAADLEREPVPEPNDGQAGATRGEKAWACSLFAAVAEPERAVFGRNFDWEYSPLLVLFLEPEEGYRSVMSVDIAYLVDEEAFGELDTAPVEDLLPLLSAPFLPFDGMNEHGLAIGMASVDYECGYPSDPDKRDAGDLRMMREVLESSATVEEALAFLEAVNPVSQGGPNMHYLIADRTDAALIEYHDGEMTVFRSAEEAPWQLGTNFPVVLTDGDPAGQCWRYDLIDATVREHEGVLTAAEAADLLQAVSTPMTRWSIVYDLAALEMHLAVERDVENAHTFSLKRGAE